MLRSPLCSSCDVKRNSVSFSFSYHKLTRAGSDSRLRATHTLHIALGETKMQGNTIFYNNFTIDFFPQA